MDSSEKLSQHRIEGWEERLIKDYYDYRWHKTLEPLCEWLQRWKNGALSHEEMDRVIEETHQQICEMRSLFSQRQDRLVLLVQWLDREWFDTWVKEHAPPPGARLISPPQ
ncbi:MAG: hypothetical protein QHJ81_11240 [Anaerolineae bacterium]|nr:hypothetical protein [Anaerolineae bacterium]